MNKGFSVFISLFCFLNVSGNDKCGLGLVRVVADDGYFLGIPAFFVCGPENGFYHGGLSGSQSFFLQFGGGAAAGGFDFADNQVAFSDIADFKIMSDLFATDTAAKIKCLLFHQQVGCIF